MLRGMRQLDTAIDALAFTGGKSLSLTMLHNAQQELDAIGDEPADLLTGPVIYMRGGSTAKMKGDITYSLRVLSEYSSAGADRRIEAR